MGEVVEINIIAQKKTMLKKLVDFTEVLKKDHISDKTVEIMDNWKYENVFQCDDLKCIDQYIDDKIVCITETLPLGVMGITGECVNKEYIFCVWYNFKYDIYNDEYSNLIKNFIKCFSTDLINNEIRLCAIGKETIFTYAKNLYQIVKTSHNIDIWILNQNTYREEYFKQYKVYSLKEYSYGIESAVIIF